MRIPLHAYELIDHLDEFYPEREYDPEMNPEERLLRAGERRLVLRLKAIRQGEIDENHHRSR